MRPTQVRVGFVSVVRPTFKGDSATAARGSLAGLERLGQELGFEVVVPHLPPAGPVAAGRTLPTFSVHDGPAALRAAEQLAAADLDFLLIQHTTFATGELLTPLLRACSRVGVWALPESAGGGAGTGPLPLNSLCGLNMTLSYAEGMRRSAEGPGAAAEARVKWFYGSVDASWFCSRLSVTIGALRALRTLASARVLQIGGTAPGFHGLEEEVSVGGAVVELLPLPRFLSRVAQVDEERARRAAAQAQAEPHEVTTEQLVRSARIELALSDVATEGGYHALAVRCWPELPDACGSMACLALGNVSTGTPAACEGDVPGALSMLALQAMSTQPAVLMDLSDMDDARDELLFWHCGNAPQEWAAGGSSRLTTHFNRDTLGVVRDMRLAPGEVTGFRLVGRHEALVFSGRLGNPSKASYDGVSGWLGDLRWNGRALGAREFVARVLDRRLAHHYALGRGDLTESLRELCHWLGRTPIPAAD